MYILLLVFVIDLGEQVSLGDFSTQLYFRDDYILSHNDDLCLLIMKM